jgi:hypothetical protein
VKRLQGEYRSTWLDKIFPFKIKPATYQARATFNVTHDPAALHDFLPYRKKLADAHSPKLAQYDALVNKILDQAEFYRVPNYEDFRNKLRPLYHGQTERSIFYPIISFFKKLGILIRYLLNSQDSFREHRIQWMQSIHKSADKIDNTVLTRMMKQNAKPLQDDSTRYMIAAGIAELLHEHPDYADTVLKPDHGRPLRFVLSTKEKALGGQTNFGSNVIWINKYSLWLFRQSNALNAHHIAQHEFLHALSESAGLTSLPMMSQEQRQRFERSRTQLFHAFDTTGLKCTPSSQAMVIHAMRDATEFLPSTLDLFKHHPQVLVQNEAGKDLYNLYQELFGIDPLNDFPPATSTTDQDKKPSDRDDV